MTGAAHVRYWTLPGVPESVRTFRDLARQESATAELAETAALCVSELVTNAIQHSWSGQPGGRVTVAFCAGRHPGELRITVTDDGSSLTRMTGDECGGQRADPWRGPGPRAGELAEHGRGLTIVGALAAEWGRTPARLGGWSVWCVLLAGADDLNLRTAADLGGPDRSPEAEAPAETRLH